MALEAQHAQHLEDEVGGGEGGVAGQVVGGAHLHYTGTNYNWLIDRWANVVGGG